MENQEKKSVEQTPVENEMPKELPKKQSRLYSLKILVLVAFAAFGAAIAGLALLTNIMERKNEARNPFFRVVELTDDISDPEIWGKNFPLLYDGYKRTVDQQRTRYAAAAKPSSARRATKTRARLSHNRVSKKTRV